MLFLQYPSLLGKKLLPFYIVLFKVTQKGWILVNMQMSRSSVLVKYIQKAIHILMPLYWKFTVTPTYSIL